MLSSCRPKKQLISDVTQRGDGISSIYREGITRAIDAKSLPAEGEATVKWVGVLENNSVSKGGYWVGVVH